MLITRTLVTTALLATGLLLSGCGEPPSSITTTPPSESSSSSAAPDSTTESSSTTGDSGTSQGGTGNGTHRCPPSALTASLGQTTGEAGQRHTTVVWTNTSGSTCTMTGFGGVDLKGPNHPMGPTYSLPRATKKASAVSLAKGGTAHTTITWLPQQEADGWTPTALLITPPDGTTSTSLKWPGGAISRQDAATHPGSYIDPVAAGSHS